MPFIRWQRLVNRMLYCHSSFCFKPWNDTLFVLSFIFNVLANGVFYLIHCLFVKCWLFRKKSKTPFFWWFGFKFRFRFNVEFAVWQSLIRSMTKYKCFIAVIITIQQESRKTRIETATWREFHLGLKSLLAKLQLYHFMHSICITCWYFSKKAIQINYIQIAVEISEYVLTGWYSFC